MFCQSEHNEMANIYITGVAEGEGSEQWSEINYEEIMAEYILK